MSEAEPTPSLVAVSRALRGRMLRAAVFSFDKLDIRAASGFERSGLFEKKPISPPSEEILAVLEDDTHEDRQGVAKGPLLFVKDRLGNRLAIEVEYFLLNDDLRTRKAAWTFFHALGLGDEILSTSTQRLLADQVVEIESETKARWQEAAISLFDAIRGDLRCVLATVNQSLASRYEEGLSRGIPRLVSPSIESMERLGITLATAENREQMAKNVADAILCGPGSPAEKCGRFLNELGFIPIAGEGRFRQFLDRLLHEAAAPQSVLEEIFLWEHESRNPLASFHAIAAMSEVPEWFSKEQRAAIFQDFLSACAVSREEGQNDSKEPGQWQLREELGAYYMKYFETAVPGASGAVVSTWAWWLSDRVATVFSSFPFAIERFRNVALIPAARLNELGWQMVDPKIGRDKLVLGTHWAAPWRLSLLMKLSVPSAASAQSHLSPELWEEIESAVTPGLMFGDLSHIATSDRNMYLFDGSAVDAIERWGKQFGRSERVTFWEQLYERYSKAEDAQSYLQGLNMVATLDEMEQFIFATSNRRLWMLQKLPFEEIGKLLGEKKWRQDFFGKANLSAMEAIVAAWIWSTAQGDVKWRHSLPHILALACEESEGDKQRADLLFALTLCASVFTYSVSAIERILKGQQRLQYSEAARSWASTCVEISNHGSKWVGARSRAVQAAISASLAS